MLSSVIYSQDCEYITTQFDILPDSFFIGLKYPSPTAATYESFGLPVSSLVKFNIYDIDSNLFAGTEYCLLEQGYYRFDWSNLFRDKVDFKSGIYYLEISCKSPKDHKKTFKGDRKIIVVW